MVREKNFWNMKKFPGQEKSVNSIFNQGYSRKKYLGGGGGGGGGEEGKRYIFLWVVGADIFQIIWVIGV